MKKIIIAALILFSLSVQAQKTKKVKSTKATSAKVLANLADSASYALGLNVAKFYQQQGFKNLNTSLIAKAISDVQAKRKPLLGDETANECIMFYMNPALRQIIEEGKRFLAQNKTKPGVKTTASGLQ